MALSYEDRKRQIANRAAAKVKAACEIGDIPSIVDPKRRKKAFGSFKFFCETYFSTVFALEWSQDHLKVIKKIEEAVKSGGLFALAMPRGSGKTTLCQAAVLWTALTGQSQFIVLVAASAERAKDLLDTIKTWLETNELLFDDFPEACFPIRKLERIVHRQRSQTFQGEHTRIEWGADKIVFPTIPGAESSGVIVTASGMRGSDIRGQNHSRPDGTVVRPTLVLIDDPQTTESAWSYSQSRRREAIVAGDVLGMAGPGKKIAGLMACTVIRPGDMADSILNRDKHPEWKGERTKLMYSFPENEKLWNEYNEMRADELKNDGDGHLATAFYKKHRAEMDKGAKPAWPQRFNDDEISAIQHAMNLKLRDEEAFFAEYQNEPIQLQDENEQIDGEETVRKVSGLARGMVPVYANYITAFIDVQQKALFYLIAAWGDNFSGSIIDYGTYPDQHRRYFTLSDIKATLGRAAPGAGLEGSIYAGLEKLCGKILERVYLREDGAEMRINRCMIDANWGLSTDIVYQFCRQSKFSGILLPSHGRFVGAKGQQFSDYRRKNGDQIGLHWRIPFAKDRRAIRYCLIDTNYWKTFIMQRLNTAMGDPGCLTFFGVNYKEHDLLAEHLNSEYKISVTANNRTVDEWKLKVEHTDNHWFDCLVGSAVGASMCGASLNVLEKFSGAKIQRKRVSFAEIQARKKQFA